MIGQAIAHFHVLEELRGIGTPVVYLAENARLDRNAALKIPQPRVSSDEGASRRFVQEAEAATALNHANTCDVYVIGQTDDGQTLSREAHWKRHALCSLNKFVVRFLTRRPRFVLWIRLPTFSPAVFY